MISRSIILCLSIIAAVATAFAPSSDPSTKWSTKTSTYAPMKRVGFASPPPSFGRNRCANGVCANMSSDPEAEAAKLREQAQKLREEAAEAAGVSVEELTAAATNPDGTVYDDDIPPPRETLSSGMRERLTREASSGLDSNKGQTNVILYISAAVVLLVLAGGQGILY